MTTALSRIPRADVRRVQIPVLAIETQQLHGDAYRRFAEFEILILLAAEHQQRPSPSACERAGEPAP